MKPKRLFQWKAMMVFVSAACLAIALATICATPASAVPIYIDVSSGTPVIPNTGYYFPTPTVTQTGPSAWRLTFGLLGGYRGTSTANRGLELTDPDTGNILYSFGVTGFSWNDYYSMTTVFAELYTVDSTGALSGRTSRIYNALVASEAIEPDTYQLALSGINTEWLTYDIYLRGFVPSVEGGQTPVPEPGTCILLAAGLAGIAMYGRRRASSAIDLYNHL